MLKKFTDKKTLAVAVFVLGTLSLIAYGMKYRAPSGVGRTIHFRQTWTASDGIIKLDADMVKYTRGDGFWKSVCKPTTVAMGLKGLTFNLVRQRNMRPFK